MTPYTPDRYFRLASGSVDIDAGDPGSPDDADGSRADRGIIWDLLPSL